MPRPVTQGRAVQPGAAENASSDSEEVPENIPEDATLEQVDHLLTAINKGMQRAEKDGNLSALASLATKATALALARRKLAPPPKVDLNESPDFVALGEQVEKRLFKLIDDAFTGA